MMTLRPPAGGRVVTLWVRCDGVR